MIHTETKRICHQQAPYKKRKAFHAEEKWHQWRTELSLLTGKAKWYSHSGKQFGNLLNAKHSLTTWSTPSCLPRRNKSSCPYKDFYINVYNSTVCNSQKLEEKSSTYSRWVINCYAHTMEYYSAKKSKLLMHKNMDESQVRWKKSDKKTMHTLIHL